MARKILVIFENRCNKILELIEFLLDNGADVNASFEGTSPLFCACMNRDLKIVELIVNYGGKLNHYGKTVLEAHLMHVKKHYLIVSYFC
jgi:ankyrin repeat protein